MTTIESLIPTRKCLHEKEKPLSNKGVFITSFFSENLTNITETVLIKSRYRSDHSVVVYELKFNTFEQGKGLWKFNKKNYFMIRYMLKSKKKNIQSVKDQYNNSIDESAFLDILLMEIRGITISYSSYRKRENDKTEKQLIFYINELENSNDF